MADMVTRMIAFGTAISDRKVYEEVALPGIKRVAEPDSPIVTRTDHDSIQRAYNEIMDAVAGLPGLEALVLLHQDTELLDDSLLRRMRAHFEDPRVGLVGVLGVRSPKLHLFWWEADFYGALTAPGVDTRPTSGAFEVEIVDGSLLAIARWVVESIRFSEALADCFHGYDADLCLRVRALGGRVICDDIPYFHHMNKQLESLAGTAAAGRIIARSWDPALRPPEWIPAFQR